MSRSRLQRAFILRSALRLMNFRLPISASAFTEVPPYRKCEAVGRVLVGVVKPFGLRLADGGKSGGGEKREILPDILVVAGEGQFKRGSHAPDPFASRNQAMVDFALLGLSSVDVRPVAGVSRHAHGEIARDPIASRREICIPPKVTVGARLESEFSRRLRTRVPSDDVDDSARRIASEQGALRPVQDLDPLDAAQVEKSADGRGEINPIDDRSPRCSRRRGWTVCRRLAGRVG